MSLVIEFKSVTIKTALTVPVLILPWLEIHLNTPLTWIPFLTLSIKSSSQITSMDLGNYLIIFKFTISYSKDKGFWFTSLIGTVLEIFPLALP